MNQIRSAEELTGASTADPRVVADVVTDVADLVVKVGRLLDQIHAAGISFPDLMVAIDRHTDAMNRLCDRLAKTHCT